MFRFVRDLPRRRFLLSLAAAFAWATACPAAVTVVETVDPAPGFSQYTANRAPLAASRLVELPFGAVKPEGWLRRQLQLQADGFHGHLTEISGFLKKEKNAWLDRQGTGEHGWEEVPYWLKGFIGCAYLLENRQMIDEAGVWIEGCS